MTKKIPVQCPSCGDALILSALRCEACETVVSGKFELPVLAQLSQSEQTFIIDFVRSSGSLKEMAKKMGLSYPTVRNLLDDIINKLNKNEQL